MMFEQNVVTEIGQDPDPNRMDFGADGTLGSHKGLYAWDMTKDIGTPIFAARGGIVWISEESYDCNQNDDGEDKDSCPGNRIVIEHQDGSVANYSHLKQFGSLVSKNDIVQRGQAIGFTGNTGNSNAPHLHWANEFLGENVYDNDDDIAEPARFRLRKKQANGSFTKVTCYAPVTGDEVKKY